MGRLSGFQTPHFVAQVQNGRSSAFLSIILWDSFSVLFCFSLKQDMHFLCL